MTPLLRSELGQLNEILIRDVLWLAHDTLDKHLVSVVQRLVHSVVREAVVSDAMDVHEVHLNGQSEW